MNVNKWGNPGWEFLHTITFNYPLKPTSDDKKRYIEFFNSVGKMLPCKYCRDSYNIYIKYLPIELCFESSNIFTISEFATAFKILLFLPTAPSPKSKSGLGSFSR